jgi:N6-L-threonylcarbamoyladenine synthase
MGVSTAKALAFAKDLPLVGVHHLMSHISANFIEYPELEPPFMALITSGGHTEIVKVSEYNKCEILGGTRDDAVGEAYDKVARVLGLGYPGGPKIDKIANEGNPEAIHFKRVYLEKDSYDFSFSGLKTAVLNYINTEKQAGREINRADVAASFQEAVMDVITEKAVDAVKASGMDKLAMAGGVAANSRLREKLGALCEKEGIQLYRPHPALCTDNGAMVACAAYYKYKNGETDGLDLDASPSLPL